MTPARLLAPSHAAQETFQDVSRLEPSCPVSGDVLVTYARDFAGRGRGGWRAVGEILGVSGGTAYEIAHGNRPITHEQTLLWQVYKANIEGNNPNVQIVQTVTCPSCGKLHQVQDCHGQAGEVAIVSVAALPSPAKPTRKRAACWRPYIPARHRAELEPLITYWLAAQDEPAPPAWVSEAAGWLAARQP